MIRSTIEDALKHSYRNFHAKGFDYLCLKRSAKETVKIYTFADEAAYSSEVVCPHDHRYDFTTTVLAGTLQNLVYVPRMNHYSQLFYRHNYRTPLNGGNGFEPAGATYLALTEHSIYGNGEICQMLAEQIHTIRVDSRSILMLEQAEDRNVVHTATYSRHETMPSLSGLYRRFYEGEFMDKLHDVCEAVGADLKFFDNAFEFNHHKLNMHDTVETK